MRVKPKNQNRYKMLLSTLNTIIIDIGKAMMEIEQLPIILRILFLQELLTVLDSATHFVKAGLNNLKGE